jgi:hypothetical protein
MEADNNLEGDAIADMLEMEMAGSSDDVNILVQIDRATGYSQADGDWTDARRYYIQRNPNANTIEDLVVQKRDEPDSLTIYSPVLEELGETNNGDPQTLIDFALWGADNYPADKYALIMWNHGGTWVAGFGGDESTPEKDALTMPEIDSALDTITTSIGQKFEFIGFDACLMGQLETFTLLAPYARYASGAEELEPAFGWYYTPVIEQLISDPAMNGDGLGTAIVENYMAFYGEIMPDIIGRPFWMEYDHSIVNLQNMEQVESSIIAFAEFAQANADTILPITSDARNNTQFFGGSTPDASDPLSSVDIIHFMELLQSLSEDDTVDSTAQNVIDAIDDLIVLSAASDGLANANGTSIFFPRNASKASIHDNDVRYSSELDYMQSWNTFLESFFESAEKAAGPVAIEIIDIFQLEEGPFSLNNPPTFIMATDGTNLSNMVLTAAQQYDDGFQYVTDLASLVSATYAPDGELYEDIEDGYHEDTYTWPTEMTVITDGENSVQTLLLDTGNDDQLSVSGIYTDQAGNTTDAYLIFEIETRSAIAMWGINASENGDQPFEITPQSGDTFTPTWRMIDTSGEELLLPAFDTLTFGEDPFTYWFEPTMSGTYLIRISVEDAAGNYYYDEVEIEVNNDDIDPSYRHAIDLVYGYAIPIPWEWPAFDEYELDDGRIQTIVGNDEGTITIYIEAYDATELDDAQSIIEDYVYDTSMIIVEEAAPTTLGDYDGYLARYEFDYDGDLYNGELLSIFAPDTDMVYLFDLEILEGYEQEAAPVRDMLYTKTRLFEPVDLE